MDAYDYMKTSLSEEKPRTSSLALKSQGPPLNTWYEFRTEKGQPYYHNPVTKTSLWKHPLELFKTQRAIKLRNIAGSEWKLAFCKDGRTFFYHPESKTRTWTMPEELHELLDTAEEEVDINDESIEEEEISRNTDIVEQQQEEETFDVSVTQEAKVQLTSEERILEFRNMLKEQNINPFSTWEIEVTKLEKDPRFECKMEKVIYVLLTIV
jgi:hypothetical protein